VRVAVVADIHANAPALSALGDVLDSADHVVCLGDLVGYYCDVNEVISEVRRVNATCVTGNHDWFLLHGYPENAAEAVRFGIEYADRVIDPEHRSWLAAQPLSWSGVIDSQVWLLCHGSPWRPLNDYLYEDNPQLERLSEFDCDVVAFGQTHRPLLREHVRPLLLNPGSVGQSRHATGIACAAVVDTETMSCELIERPPSTSCFELQAVRRKLAFQPLCTSGSVDQPMLDCEFPPWDSRPCIGSLMQAASLLLVHRKNRC
jgi:putative phosphoesterase